MERQRWIGGAVALAVAAGLAGISSCRGSNAIVDPLGKHAAESVARIEVVAPAPSVEVASTLQLDAIAYCKHGLPMEDVELAWSTTTPSTATVDAQTGLLTALRTGSAGIRVEAEGIREYLILHIDPFGRTITPSGGEIGYREGRVSLVVDEGALTEDARITVEEAEPPVAASPGRSIVLPGEIYRFGPVDLELERPPLVTFLFAEADLPPGTDPRRLRIHRLQDQAWLPLEAAAMDLEAHTVSGRTPTLGAFALLDYRPSVGTVAIAPSEGILEVGTTTLLTASILDRSGEPVPVPDVVWSSNDPAVASVDSGGMVTALKPGWATVTADSDGETAHATVAVFTPLDRVTIEPSELWMAPGETAAVVTHLVTPDGATVDQLVAWSSEDESVAVVDAEGVRALALGETAIRASSGGQSAVVSVHVTGTPASLVISPSGGYHAVGDTVRLGALVLDAQGNELTRPVSWKASEPGVFVGEGLLVASAPVIVVVTARSGALDASTVFFFVAPGDIASTLEVAPPTLSLEVGQTSPVTATVRDPLGMVVPDAAVTWTSGDPAVATIDQAGAVTGVAQGATLLVARSGGAVGVGEVVVLAPATAGPPNSVQIWPQSLALAPGEGAQLHATVYDASGRSVANPVVAWTSDAPGIATVDDRGLVNAVADGTATVTATSAGLSGTVGVTVDSHGGSGGHEEGLGNNLSWPVVFTEGYGVTGLPVGTDAGLRPTAAEGIAVTGLPFFAPTNAPDYSAGGTDFFLQQGSNTWQAEWLDGSASAQSAEVTWGDNLTHHTFSTHGMIRVEVSLASLDVGPLVGYVMTSLYGQGSTEMQGTDGSTATYTPSLYTVAARLRIEKLDNTTLESVYVAFDGSVADGLVTEGPGSFGAEVNVGGRIIYGYNLRVRDVPVPAGIEKHGWWRLTFSLDDAVTIDGQSVARGLSLDRCGNEPDDEELIYTPVLDTNAQRTVLDVWIASASGGGGGGGGHGGGGGGGGCGGH